MKLKKYLGIILAGAISVSIVGCSAEETSVESGSATPIEEKQEQDKEETKKEEIVLVDDETVKVIITEKMSDAFGAGYKVSVENKTDNKIIVQTRDTSVDGTMEDPIFSPEVMPGKKSNDSMQFMNITEIDALKAVEGKLVVMDENYSDIKTYDITID